MEIVAVIFQFLQRENLFEGVRIYWKVFDREYFYYVEREMEKRGNVFHTQLRHFPAHNYRHYGKFEYNENAVVIRN